MSTKLTAFITAFKFRKTQEEKESFVREHIKNEYVPYEKKQAVAEAIVKASYWAKDGDREYLHINSAAKYMLTCLSMVDLYTDIERNRGNSKALEDFNTLNSYGVFDIIIKFADPKEIKEFDMVLQMACDDLIANEYENHAFIRNQVERFGKLISATLTPILEGLDLDKIKELAGLAEKM